MPPIAATLWAKLCNEEQFDGRMTPLSVRYLDPLRGADGRCSRMSVAFRARLLTSRVPRPARMTAVIEV